MHSVNAVFLLGETSLNGMVSFFFSFLFLFCLWLSSSRFQLLLLNTCRDFQCFDLHILSCGPAYLWFFNGSYMPLFQCGKNMYLIFLIILLFNWRNSVVAHNSLTFVTGGLILSLTCHPHMHPCGMFLNSIGHRHANRVCKTERKKKTTLPLPVTYASPFMC